MSSSEEVIEFYTKFADKYDEVVFRDGDYIAYRMMPHWVVEKLPKEASVLDLGCGTGLSSLPFFKMNHRVTGVDITPKMIEQCRRLPFTKLYCQSLEEPLPVPNASCNAVIMLGVMEFIQNVPLLFCRVAQALTQRGIFALTVPKKLSDDLEKKLGIKTYDLSEIESIISNAGFAIEREEDFQGFMHEGEVVLYRGYLLCPREFESKN